jgi:hypothetical protein
MHEVDLRRNGMPKVRKLFRKMQSPGEPIRSGAGGALSSVDGVRYIKFQPSIGAVLLPGLARSALPPFNFSMLI